MASSSPRPVNRMYFSMRRSEISQLADFRILVSELVRFFLIYFPIWPSCSPTLVNNLLRWCRSSRTTFHFSGISLENQDVVRKFLCFWFVRSNMSLFSSCLLAFSKAVHGKSSLVKKREPLSWRYLCRGTRLSEVSLTFVRWDDHQIVFFKVSGIFQSLTSHSHLFN